jgi:ParB family chromosome partitioning protein
MNMLGVGVNAIALENLNQLNMVETDSLAHIPLTQLIPGLYQPRNRNEISSESISELLNSIKEVGILQPIIVRKNNNTFEIIAGERRFLAGRELGLKSIPCLVKDIDEKGAFALAIVENIQREQLTPLEESEALQKLKLLHNISVDEVAKLIGKPRTTISNMIRVAEQASPSSKEFCKKGFVEFGHIRAVLSLDHREQEVVLKYVIQYNLSVRKAEELVRSGKYQRIKEPTRNQSINEDGPISDHYMRKLTNYYELPVKLKKTSDGKIRMIVDFTNIDALVKYLAQIEGSSDT